MKLNTAYSVGEVAYIVDLERAKARVRQILISEAATQYQVAYFNDGIRYEVWVHGDELSKVGK